jgi:hypothetical protein
MPPSDASVSTVPTARRPAGLLRRATGWLTSPRLAIALLLVVLACCLAGVTVVRGPRAGQLIFSTLWFNGLLVLLAVSSGTAFFSRIWRRRLTLLSAGMILFHLSFVALLGGVVVNSLLSFHGVLRLTEGETLPNDQPQSYDAISAGRFFDFRRLRGETMLVKMHRDYDVGGANKRAAYEIKVGAGDSKVLGIIYITEYLDHDGLRYFCLKEGYSVLLVMSDGQGREIFGAHVPLQSIPRPDGTHTYAAGSAGEALAFLFPPPPDHPRAELKVTYWPGAVERTGQVALEVRPFGPTGPGEARSGLVEIGQAFDAGDLVVSPREIRYWVGMDVRSDPGLPVIWGSLVFGLVGMVLTLVGRLRQGARRKAA